MSGNCKQLSLLLWKNWILKKRTLCSSLVEIVVPVIFLSFLVLIRGAVSVDEVDESLNLDYTTTVSEIQPSFIQTLACGQALNGPARSFNQSVAFSPDSGVDFNVIQSLVDDVRSAFLPAAAIEGEFICVTDDGVAMTVNATDFVMQRMFRTFASTDELNDYYEDENYGMDDAHSPLFMGINIGATSPNWAYTVRVNISDTPWTGILINNLLVGFDETIWTTYIRNGVLAIQFLVNQFILESQTGTSAPLDATFVPFPNPNYKQDNFQAYVGDIFGLFLVFGFMYPFSRLVRNLVEEKEKKIKEGMKMMGLRNWTFWVSWSITYLIIFLITMVAFLGISKSSLFKYSEFGILFVFFLGFALSMVALGCLLTSFFSKAKSAGTLSPFALMLGYLPYFAVSSSTGSTTNKNAACLLSPVALSLGSNNILAWESAFQGARAENASEVVNNFALGTAIGMLYFDTVFYFVLAWYLDKVWPSEYGTQLPWYFLFTKKYWVSCLPQREGAEREDRPLLAAEMKTFNEVVDFGPNYEAVSQKLAEATGVSIRGLRKEFPGEDGQPFVSVHGLNLDMYKGQVFVLLGHNGAGKTTTINMLTGMLPPTAGSAGVFGVDIVDDMDKIRSMMGVCPQHDTLFDSLTVKEHLEFFGGIKGLKGEILASEVKTAIEEVQLEEKINAEARTLSGGQKRRLSLAIALIGDSKVVFLDEPTSGVDPHSRRAIWDLLTKKKQNRVIVLTTHFMDEADQLGDRIGILHKGKMKCCGSSLFLKRKYGVGYVMTLNKTPACEGQKVTELVKSHVPQAERLSEVGTELVYRLPLGSASEFPSLLDELDRKKTALGLNNYGLSVTTLEEVFLKVANDASASVEEKKDTSELIRSISERRGSGGAKHASEMDEKLEGSVQNKTFGRHFSALMVKRFHIAKRDRKAQCCQFLLPLIMIAAGLGLLHIPPGTQFPTVDFSAVNKYNQPLPLPVTSNMPQPIIDNLTPSNPIKITATDLVNVSNYLLDTRDSFKESRYAAYFQYADVNASAPYDNYNFTIFSNVTAWHGLPTFLNLGFESILRILKNDPSASISVKNHPFSWTWREKEAIQNINGIFAAIVISMGMVFIPASMGTFIVKEREVKARHLQNISGVGIVAYWTSNFLWDFICFLIPAICAALIVLAYDNPVFVGDNFGALFLAFLLYGLSVIPFTYVLSFFFKSSSTAQNVMIMIYLFSGIGMTMANFALYVIPSTTEANSKYIRHLFRLLPNFCLGDSIFYLGIRSFLDLGRYDLDVTGYDYIFMLVEAIVYFIMTLMIDYVASIPSFMSRFRGDPNIPLDERQLDHDVYQEMSRLKSGQAEDDLIRVEGLRKVYHPRKVAARDVWFGIPSGQCFGFLGVNGAGKTTTLKMLTGDEIPSTGRAHLGGFDISEESEEVRKIMGYCPQFDAIFELLTAKETLEFYGRIRGIPEEKLPAMVDALIQRLSLTDYRDRAAGKYSGGNKRKLSVAIALIGNPKVVFLDEPSTGMDPVSRRFMWDFISETMSTRAVILTTHSMEECEALCDRIGIFVNGQLECLGSSQHLKTRFGRGLQIDISTADKDVEGAKAFINRFFPGAQEIECYGNNLKYKIETKNSLADIFKLIESNKEKVGISDYSVGQTTLEQIFINFAKMGEVQLAAAGVGGVVGGVAGDGDGIPEASGHGTRAPIAYTRDLPDKKDDYMPRSDSDIELAASPEHHSSGRKGSRSSSRASNS